MSKNIFEIYGEKTRFWQWDTKQKLIVLDDNITKVHFSNKGMRHAIPADVYESDGMRLCDIPDALLQIPRDLIVYACDDGSTLKSAHYMITKRPGQNDCIIDETDGIDIEQLNKMLKEVLA